jgi:hypothetical protein
MWLGDLLQFYSLALSDSDCLSSRSLYINKSGFFDVHQFVLSCFKPIPFKEAFVVLAEVLSIAKLKAHTTFICPPKQMRLWS